MPSAAQRVYTVSLELLRHGPPHNQLLSKVTEYLALCGDLGAVSVFLPFDHAEYERRLDALSYGGGSGDAEKREAQRRGQLDEFGEHMRDLLAAVPGLPAALAEANSLNVDLAHLRLVITPNELALLPFECAFVPEGAPGGAGQRLSLQGRAPVAITRQVRGVAAPVVEWPLKPRILFAWASPPGVDPVPFEEHVVQLRRALSPWIRTFQGYDRDDDRRRNVREQVKARLTLLPDASIEAIRDACSTPPGFTHIHLLAHGVPAGSGGAARIGLALHNSFDATQLEIVEGGRLAAALGFHSAKTMDRKGRAAMVTIASCDSGRVPSVVSHGASLAHQLHLAGVPVVVASQFPLSFAGSVLMVGELYQRVLAGEDVRVALHYTRSRLFAALERTHDWASLVAYAALPVDFETQLTKSQYVVAKNNVEHVLDEADAIVSGIQVVPGGPEAAHARLRFLLRKLPELATELGARHADGVETLGLRGSIQKRMAQMLFHAAQNEQLDHSKAAYLQDSLEALRRARTYYYDALRRDLWNHWVAVQYLSLTRLLVANEALDASCCGPDWDLFWRVALMSAERDRDRGSGETVAWAYGSLAELHLLRTTLPAGQQSADLALANARSLLQLVERESFAAYSTGRQFSRYAEWWAQPLSPNYAAKLEINPLAGTIANLFPKARAFSHER
jgi:CHAT domain-containing protein